MRAIAANALPLIAKVVEEVADDIIQELIENYNTAEPGETYERTGPDAANSLGGSWEVSSVRNQSDQLVVVIFNDAIDERGRAYSSFVQGPNQTGRHAGAGWKTIKEVQDSHAHSQSNKVRAAIRKAGQ